MARRIASAVPHESSTSPSPAAPAPTAAARWSWPATARIAPFAPASVATPAERRARGGVRRGEPGWRAAQSSAGAHRRARVKVVEARARGERRLGPALAAEPEHDPLGDVDPAHAASGAAQCERIHAYFASVQSVARGQAGPLGKVRQLGREPLRLGGSAGSYQAIEGTTGRSAWSASTPVSAMLGHADPGHVAAARRPQRRRGRLDRGAEPARPGRARRPCRPPATASPCAPCASSRPSPSTTAAFTDVVPTSSPSKSAPLTGGPCARAARACGAARSGRRSGARRWPRRRRCPRARR